MLEAVLLDVDFTLFRPGPELGPEGYRRIGARHGLSLEPNRYDDARLAAVANLQRHPDFVHDEELWVAFTEEIGVPRFELGASPTRTERATRLRHTPRAHRVAESSCRLLR